MAGRYPENVFRTKDGQRGAKGACLSNRELVMRGSFTKLLRYEMESE